MSFINLLLLNFYFFLPEYDPKPTKNRVNTHRNKIVMRPKLSILKAFTKV